MRRRISLAVVMAAAVLAAIAAGGASSAAASEFCETNSGSSPCAAPYVPTTILEMKQTSAQANFSPSPPGPGVSASCAHSTAEVEYVAPALRLEAKVLSFTFSSCTGCSTVKAAHLPWAAEAEARGSGNGTFNIFDTKGLIELVFSGCNEVKTSCTFHQEQILSSFGGGAPAVTEISSSLPLLSGGSGCEKTIKWSPTAYEFSFPSPLYLR